MSRYIALIRGINVGGKNKVSMATLKEELEKVGHEEVLTYINSGNVIFSSSKKDLVKLVEEFEALLERVFDVSTHVAVISVAEFHDAIKHAPKWWNDGSSGKHDALFVIAPAKAEDIFKEVGEAKPDYEKVKYYKHIIFWSAPLETYSRTRWSKIVGTTSYNKVTIRNANTVRKLIELTLPKG